MGSAEGRWMDSIVVDAVEEMTKRSVVQDEPTLNYSTLNHSTLHQFTIVIWGKGRTIFPKN